VLDFDGLAIGGIEAPRDRHIRGRSARLPASNGNRNASFQEICCTAIFLRKGRIPAGIRGGL